MSPMEVRFVHPQKSGDPPTCSRGVPNWGGAPKQGAYPKMEWVPQNGVCTPKQGGYPRAQNPPCSRHGDLRSTTNHDKKLGFLRGAEFCPP